MSVQAARYQIMIMFLIAATTCIAVVGSVYLAVLNIMDRQHRLCSEKILPRSAHGSGVEHWIQAQTVKVDLYYQHAARWIQCSKQANHRILNWLHCFAHQ